MQSPVEQECGQMLIGCLLCASPELTLSPPNAPLKEGCCYPWSTDKAVGALSTETLLHATQSPGPSLSTPSTWHSPQSALAESQ